MKQRGFDLFSFLRRDITIPDDKDVEFEHIRVLYDDDEIIERERLAYNHYISLPEGLRCEEVLKRWWPRYFRSIA